MESLQGLTSDKLASFDIFDTFVTRSQPSIRAEIRICSDFFPVLQYLKECVEAVENRFWKYVCSKTRHYIFYYTDVAWVNYHFSFTQFHCAVLYPLKTLENLFFFFFSEVIERDKWQEIGWRQKSATMSKIKRFYNNTKTRSYCN